MLSDLSTISSLLQLNEDMCRCCILKPRSFLFLKGYKHMIINAVWEAVLLKKHQFQNAIAISLLSLHDILKLESGGIDLHSEAQAESVAEEHIASRRHPLSPWDLISRIDQSDCWALSHGVYYPCKCCLHCITLRVSTNLDLEAACSGSCMICNIDDGDPRAAVARVDSRHKQPELLNQSLVCQGLFPPISCGGGVTLTKSARSETPTAINLRRRPLLCHHSSLFGRWGSRSRMGLSTAPCLAPRQVNKACQANGIFESAGFVQSSADLKSEANLAKIMSPRKDVQKPHSDCKHPMAEHHSYANLTSTFNVRIGTLGYMTVPHRRGILLRNSKSFHCEGTAPTGSTHSLGAGIGSTGSGGTVVLRHQQHQRKLMERQRLKMLKPISANSVDCSAKKLYEPNKFTAAVLPDPTTSSYRITNDVSFDEGTRYNGDIGATPFIVNRKCLENTHRVKQNPGAENRSSPYAGHGRLEKMSESMSRDRTSHVTPTAIYKEAMPMSCVRMEERVDFDSPLGRHPGQGSFVIPGSRGQSAQSVGHPPVSAVAVTPPVATITTFRLQKGKQNWNCKSDLSISGGAYYGSSPIQTGARVDVVGLGSLSINPASSLSQKISQNRERNYSLTKPRVSSRFGNRVDSVGALLGSAGKEGVYADPCLSAPPSFQQRLMELSMLETETIKYERNKKLKRKKTQDS